MQRSKQLTFQYNKKENLILKEIGKTPIRNFTHSNDIVKKVGRDTFHLKANNIRIGIYQQTTERNSLNEKILCYVNRISIKLLNNLKTNHNELYYCVPLLNSNISDILLQPYVKQYETRQQ